MKIAVCGSMTFAKEMLECKTTLEGLGHTCILPVECEDYAQGKVISSGAEGIARKREKNLIRNYFDILRDADAALVLNYDKNGVKGYVGPNSFLEIGFAHVLRKPIYLLHGIPDHHFTEEILAMEPICLNGDLNNLTI